MANPNRARILAFSILWAAIAACCVIGAFKVEKNSISVVYPFSLRNQSDAALANFGIPDYGGSIIGNLKYPTNNSDGCSNFDGDKPFKSVNSLPTFLLVDRAYCYFTFKVWNGQEAGAKSVLVVDDVEEPLLTMESPTDSPDVNKYLDKINIPSALISKSFGDRLKKALKKGVSVIVRIDWTESIKHPDQRVEYEFWTNSNDECGQRCTDQMNFVKNFKGIAQILEKNGYTMFTPHYITWYCPVSFVQTQQCQSQCINHGRYCAPDPDQDFDMGYSGKDVVYENLRQLCVHRVANESQRSWIWWDYVTDYNIRCSMKNMTYNRGCAEDVLKSLGLSIEKVKKCMGDPEADAVNELLKTEQDLQLGHGNRSDIAILPTLVINNAQYRGKLDDTAVLKAICSGFKEGTEPSICLKKDIETNECLTAFGGCWHDFRSNISACKDTFRGRICECPLVNGIQYKGDGYVSCEAVGPARCTINNGGCWEEERKGKSFTACSRSDLKGCRCPKGFQGDGIRHCEDINECKEGLACKCEECTCKNTWGDFECKCKKGFIYMKEQDTCIERSASKVAWVITMIVLASVVVAGVGGYVFYKYRLRSYMDSEIMAIMAQYMPLDGNHINKIHTAEESLNVDHSQA